MAKSDIFEANSYLKSGSNELRVLEYNVCGMSFGINILKVRKIVSHMNQFISMPETHASVRGIFEDRGAVIPLIDLSSFLGMAREENNPPQKVIITEFFSLLNGLWVDRIDWIHHFKWEDVIDAQGVMHGFDQKYVIGIVKPSEDKMVLLLDYENLILDICPQLRADASRRFVQSTLNGAGKKILVVEDSPAIRNMLVTEFTEVGFEVVQARDGREAFELFERAVPFFDLVISDVEMPRMDGLALTVAVRSSERKDTPVIVYSSIGDVGMKTRANFLQANAHITKLNFEELLNTVEKLIFDETGQPAQTEPMDEEAAEAESDSAESSENPSEMMITDLQSESESEDNAEELEVETVSSSSHKRTSSGRKKQRRETKKTGKKAYSVHRR